ncbi:hypothetical protein DC522_30310 [Microvirga sp. KLBC 81]|nr:hypothetical protein DC522_30310 [Microvirga sp. KLBC 81]
MFVTDIQLKIHAYKLYRETARELSQLSDHELADLGISRFQIASVAHQFVMKSRLPEATVR